MALKLVKLDDATLPDIANAIREKNGETATMLPGDMARKIRAIPGAKPEGPGEETFTENGDYTVSPTAGSVFKDFTVHVDVPTGGSSNIETYATRISFEDAETLPETLTVTANNLTTLEKMFFKSVDTVKTLSVNSTSQNITSAREFMSHTGTDMAENIETINLNFQTNHITDFYRMFANLKGQLPEPGIVINGEIDFSAAENVKDMFRTNSGIESIRFTPNTLRLSLDMKMAKYLDSETIESIVHGLADMTGQTAQSLTLSSDVSVPQTLKDEITAKNWTLVQ